MTADDDVRETWALRLADGSLRQQGMSQRPLTSREDVLSDWTEIPEGAVPVLLSRSTTTHFGPAADAELIEDEDGAPLPPALQRDGEVYRVVLAWLTDPDQPIARYEVEEWPRRTTDDLMIRLTSLLYPDSGRLGFEPDNHHNALLCPYRRGGRVNIQLEPDRVDRLIELLGRIGAPGTATRIDAMALARDIELRALAP